MERLGDALAFDGDALEAELRLEIAGAPSQPLTPAEGQAVATGADAKVTPTIISHDHRQYSIGSCASVAVTEAEDLVLLAFLGDGRNLPPLSAMDKAELCRRSVEHAPRVLARLRDKYDKLARACHFHTRGKARARRLRCLDQAGRLALSQSVTYHAPNVPYADKSPR